jgi:hypothetical protein
MQATRHDPRTRHDHRGRDAWQLHHIAAQAAASHRSITSLSRALYSPSLRAERMQSEMGLSEWVCQFTNSNKHQCEHTAGSVAHKNPL